MSRKCIRPDSPSGHHLPFDRPFEKPFDKPFGKLTVLSKVEGLTVLSKVEGLTVQSKVEGLMALRSGRVGS